MSTSYLASDITEIIDRLADDALMLSGKTVLLTGGRGFLGRYFIEIFSGLNRKVLEKPVNLIVLDNFVTSGKDGANIAARDNVELIEHDVINPYKSERALDYVVHAAGIASPFYYQARPLQTLDVGVMGTRNMLELAEEHNARFTFFSSSEIYGDPDPTHVPTPESYHGQVMCQSARACYDESKRVGETLCYIFHTTEGTKTSAIRPFNIFGPGMQETDYRVLPNFGNRIKAGAPLHIYGNGNQTRTFCYITDAMVGFLLVILKGVPGEAYNIGNPKPEISILQLAEYMEKVLGRELKKDIITYPDSYPGDEPSRRCPDIRKARMQLQFSPTVDLEEGLHRFLSWTDKTYSGEI
ncbi:MAG: nucleoside-diphosphate sugar epimerase [Rhodospirillaceae bacterium]|nr:nucleoside-diphosphate sugar epimerase [Rhodospirillaceae bacterium]|tara:strand:- start:12747 stop:13808 length:1062 start_codon:yes stop_codon:yes gene_type:complete